MTAEEYMMENMQGADYQEIEDALIGFAKLKCQELLEIVVEKAEIGRKKKCILDGYFKITNQKDSELKAIELFYGIDKDSILNAVDLDTFIV